MRQPESLNWPKLIDKEIGNARKSKNALLSLSEENCLDKNVLVTSFKLVPKIRDFQVYKCYDVVFFSPKSRKTQDEKGQRIRKNVKNKRDGKNKKDKKRRKGHYRNKVNLVVRKSSGFKAKVYYHIIY